jgi:hypothetical protein
VPQRISRRRSSDGHGQSEGEHEGGGEGSDQQQYLQIKMEEVIITSVSP